MGKIADVRENGFCSFDKDILTILLKDRTTGKNIIWATDEYAAFGKSYTFQKPIALSSVKKIRPRIDKSKAEQAGRAKDKAEVFTPSWICNIQNNLIDTAWFGKEGLFNTETDRGWVTTSSPILFPTHDGKTWQDYVMANRLEITCGEAPYLASRYDAVTGEEIPVANRIGLLDRKLRVVAENCHSEPDFYAWSVKAVQSIYGFEWQCLLLQCREKSYHS